MTTITFFIWFCTIGVGVGVGVGEGDGEALTPPQPQIKANRGTTKKNRDFRLKPLTSDTFELSHSRTVGLEFMVF